MKAALSIAFEQLRGKAGTLVVSKSRSGLVVRNRTTPKNPRTKTQQAIRLAFAKATGVYKNFSSAQVAAWQAYALTITKIDPVSGQPYHPTAINVFIGLAVKYLQMNPNGAIPANPPAGPFLGDSITVTAVGDVGKITFTASAPNALGVTTELLLQPLVSKNRTPAPHRYRSKAFNPFRPVLTFDVAVPPGYYAAAYRFVNVTTGQETVLQTLPVAQVDLEAEQSKPKAA